MDDVFVEKASHHALSLLWPLSSRPTIYSCGTWQTSTLLGEVHPNQVRPSLYTLAAEVASGLFNNGKQLNHSKHSLFCCVKYVSIISHQKLSQSK